MFVAGSGSKNQPGKPLGNCGIEIPEARDEDRRARKLYRLVKTHRNSDSMRRVEHQHVILVAFIGPPSSLRLLRVTGHSFLLLGFGSFRLSFPNELFLLLLNLVCRLNLSMDIVAMEGVCWGSGPDSVMALGSDLRRTEVRIIRDLRSRGLRRCGCLCRMERTR